LIAALINNDLILFSRETREFTLNKSKKDEYFPQFIFRAKRGRKIAEKLPSFHKLIFFIRVH